MSQTHPTEPPVAIVGAGPAGLRAAEVISAAGIRVAVFDRMRSAGRKFLVAGQGGLNLTHSEPLERFVTRYADGSNSTQAASGWVSLLRDFSPDDIQRWAAKLGTDTYVGSSGRVFPKGNQAATLLRAWIRKLRAAGVEFRFQHQLTSISPGPNPTLRFQSPAGEITCSPQATVFALGGGSWPETGSVGDWLGPFREAGVKVSPLLPANCGFDVPWPTSVLERAEGKPLKNIAASSGELRVRGEALITKNGIEGGAIYQLSRPLRKGGSLYLDLKPDLDVATLATRLTSHGTAGPSMAKLVSRAWKSNEAALALLEAYADWRSAEELARTAKNLPIPVARPRPIEEAISSAGGIGWEEFDDSLMLKRYPGWFAAGEMIDWEAPTGGYLLQGCFATATRAGEGVIDWIATQPHSVAS